MKTVFVSDCHISPERPEIIEYFDTFLRTVGNEADQLFILGDLFDLWLGDDIPSDDGERISVALRQLSKEIPVFCMRGNRDFLIGGDFAARSGCRLLPDICLRRFDEELILLMHGDLLCAADRSYQIYRRIVRHPLTYRLIMSIKPERRRRIANALRNYSSKAVKTKPLIEMDAAQSAVEEYMTRFAVTRLVHGHTHRPAIHEFELNGKPAQRIVLGDWYHNGSALELEAGRMNLRSLTINPSSSR